MSRRIALLVTALLVSTGVLGQGRPVDTVASEITRSVMTRGGERPLPLSASFMTGEPNKDGYTTAKYQLLSDRGWLRRGYHFLPTFFMPPPTGGLDEDYYRDAILEARRLGLPLVFYGTQWESLLINDPATQNDVWMMESDGRRLILPGTGREDLWRAVGKRWSSSAMLHKLIALYPDPPRVIFISNNEQPKPYWGNPEKDKRVMERACKDLANREVAKDPQLRNCLRRAFGDDWKRLYGKMLDGFREGLAGSAWDGRYRLVGYDAFGPLNVGRAHDWMEHSLTVLDDRDYGSVVRWDPWSEVWDGGIVSLYTHYFLPFLNDWSIMSPQAESQNLVAQLEFVRKAKPDFWFEAGVWDGWAADQWMFTDKRKNLAMNGGQLATPERYAGWVRNVMWVTRAPVVREYRDYNNTIDQTEGHLKAVADVVDQVWNEPELQRFWREGELVRDDQRKHPYNSWGQEDGGGIRGSRNYFLPVPSHPPERYAVINGYVDSIDRKVPVYAIALRIGADYMIYAHAPIGRQTDVRLEVPGAFTFTAKEVPPSGRYFFVRGGAEYRPAIGHPQRLGELVFSSLVYDERISPGSAAVAWGAKGKVDKLVFVAPYHIWQPATEIPLDILYSNANQTNFIVPKIDVPYTFGGSVRAYRDGQIVGEGWLTLGMGADALSVDPNTNVPFGFLWSRKDGKDEYTPIGNGRVTLKPGALNFLLLYGVGMHRVPMRIDGVTEDRNIPKGRVCYSEPNPLRVRLTNLQGESWAPEAAMGGLRGYEQVNLQLTDDAGNPVPGLLLGDDLTLRIEHGHCFRDPKTTDNDKGVVYSNSAKISIKR